MTFLPVDNTLEQLRSTALQELEECTSKLDLAEWRVKYLGRKGYVTGFLRELKNLQPSEKKTFGSQANQLKVFLTERLMAAESKLIEQEIRVLGENDRIDVTRPGRLINVGSYHPLTKIRREIEQAFISMGFQVVEGPEIEWDHYNFELLNIPKNHPSRDIWDTLWVDYRNERGERNMLLRTHTSPMQARIMEQEEPPIRVIVPGKVYRYEATDRTHEWHFHQVEGLAVDRGITFADMKGTLYEFARRLFGSDRKVRFRCDYFPFVEPGVDMSIDYLAPGADSHDWLEIMGAGMVHPKVLEGVGYDPEEYTGFAFGIGLERIAMLKYGIDDIRLFFDNDLRFLRQF